LRSNTLDAARRAFLGLVRGVFKGADDGKMLQEHSFDGMAGEKFSEVESFAHTYGVSFVPLPPDDKEVLVGFINGNRSHPVVLGVIDRRHRPQNWKPGEVGLHDDQAQKIHVGRGGITISGGDDNLVQGKDGGSGQGRKSRSKKLPITLTTGNSTLTIEKDKKTLAVGNASIVVQDGKITATVGGMKIILSASRVDLGGEGGPAVVTTAGPSSKVFAVT
jgi:phage gp45-like